MKSRRLSNGLEVLLVEDRRAPLVRVQLTVGAGHAADPPGRAGLARLTTQLLARGTHRHDGSELARRFAALGARFDVSTKWDYASIGVSTLTRSLAPALELWADVVQAAKLAGGELDQLLAQWRDELEARPSRRELAQQSLHRALAGEGHRLAEPPSGTPRSAADVRLEDVKSFHAGHYAPENALLVVSGDIDVAGAMAVLEPLLGKWKRSGMRPRPLPPPAPAGPAVDVQHVPRQEQTAIALGGVGVPPLHEDALPLTAAVYLLGRALHRELREERGWTYAVTPKVLTVRDGGLFTVETEVKRGTAAAAVAEFRRALDRLSAGPIDPGRLHVVRQHIEREHQRATSPEAEAARVARVWWLGVPTSEHDRLVRASEHITADEVRRAIARYLRPERLRLIVVGDEEPSVGRAFAAP